MPLMLKSFPQTAAQFEAALTLYASTPGQGLGIG